MHRIHGFIAGLALLCASPAWGSPPAGQGASPVIILLQSNVTVQEYLVQVGSIATLRGGDAALRAAMAVLDLAELTPANKEQTISAPQVTYRLRMAGFDPEQFRVLGERPTRVMLVPATLTEECLLAAARHEVRQRLAGPAQAVITLAQPMYLPYLATGRSDRIRLSARLTSIQAPLGRVPVEITVFINGRPNSRVRILLDVRVVPPMQGVPRRINPAAFEEKQVQE